MKEITGNNEHERYVFVADEVIFQVIHPTFIDDESAARIRGNIVSAINSFIRQEENPWGNSLDLLDEGNAIILTLSSLTQIEESEETSERFSLIPIKISKHEKNDTNQIDVLNLLNDAYTGLEGRFINPEGEAGDRFLRIRLDENFEDIYLKSISANWLASGLHHGGNTGGPGSMPGRKPAPSKPEKKFKFELDGDNPLESLSEYRRPGAQVAILDTARSLNEFNIFPDIKEMFAPMQVFRCDPLLIVMDEYTKLPHHYEMADHGTFIASIIRAITKARIYLYEVLNSFGIGSLISIAQGVVDAINQRERPLILNCSFMLDDNLVDLEEELDINIDKLKETDIQTLLKMSIRDVFHWATHLNPDVVVVASAGNDGDHTAPTPGSRPEASYPAAFEKVLSVTALPKGHPRNVVRKFRPATFTSSAHSVEPNKDRALSFATFGGDMVPGTLSPKGGVLGVYIGKIPRQDTNGSFLDGPVNKTGWAQWSGTSFAAPIISGLLVAQEGELEFKNPDIPGKPYITIDDENAILVRQEG